MKTEYCKCGKRANQRLIMKTVLIEDSGRSPGFQAGDTWNSAGAVFLCNSCAHALFAPYADNIEGDAETGSRKHRSHNAPLARRGEHSPDTKLK